jgi:hypothetical protein
VYVSNLLNVSDVNKDTLFVGMIKYRSIPEKRPKNCKTRTIAGSVLIDPVEMRIKSCFSWIDEFDTNEWISKLSLSQVTLWTFVEHKIIYFFNFKLQPFNFTLTNYPASNGTSGCFYTHSCLNQSTEGHPLSLFHQDSWKIAILLSTLHPTKIIF